MTDRIKELEAQAAMHRAGLAAALSGIARGAQPTALASTDLAQSAARLAMATAKKNPLATALVGAGLVMIAANTGKTKPSAPKPEAMPQADAETMRASLHEDLGQLPPEARKRVIRKRIEALEAQEDVEKHPTTPLAIAKKHPFALLVAAAGIAFAAKTLWPTKARKAQAKRDQSVRAAETQLQVEEARIQPFPSGPAPTHHFHHQDRI